jgi:hypothetical protein
VSALARYVLVTAARTRTPLAPLAIGLFALLGVYAYRRSEVGETFGLTALMCCGLAAWLVGAVLEGEPRAQAEIATAALGGWGGRARLESVLAALVAAGLTVGFVVYPLLLGAVVPEVFERGVRAGDVLAAVLAHASCALLGGAVAILFAPPRLARRASAIAAVLATLLGLVAIARPLGGLGGPPAVADALSDAAAGTVTGAELLACASCAALATLALAVARRWAGRAG